MEKWSHLPWAHSSWVTELGFDPRLWASRMGRPPFHDSDLTDDFRKASRLEWWGCCLISFLSRYSKYGSRISFPILISHQRTQGGPDRVDMETVAVLSGHHQPAFSLLSRWTGHSLTGFTFHCVQTPEWLGSAFTAPSSTRHGEGTPGQTLVMALAWAMPWPFALIWAAWLHKKAGAQGLWCLQDSASSACYSHLSEIPEAFE